MDINKSKLLPSFSIGYLNQSIIGNYSVNGVNQFYDASKRFSSVQASMAIPIFARAEVAQIKASKLEREVAEVNADYYKSELISEYERVYQDFLKYSASIEYYENNALPQAELIISNTEKSYSGGSISYIEYLYGVNTAIDLKYKYIHLLWQYNQSVIAIEYLRGTK